MLQSVVYSAGTPLNIISGGNELCFEFAWAHWFDEQRPARFRFNPDPIGFRPSPIFTRPCGGDGFVERPEESSRHVWFWPFRETHLDVTTGV